MRIVSLVPSLTELLIDLGLENELVGRTKFCIHPHDVATKIPKIGGTKNVRIDAVIQLQPDLIIANKEENTKEDIELLKQHANVYVTEISNFQDALGAIGEIGMRTNRVQKSKAIIQQIESAFSSIRKDSLGKKVCYLIWNDPPMSVGKDTFIHDMLSICGFENLFGNQWRYPTTTTNELKALNPDYVLLSSEPFPFKEKHLQHYQQNLPYLKIELVDGEYFSWYGSRMIGAAAYFNQLITKLNQLA